MENGFTDGGCRAGRGLHGHQIPCRSNCPLNLFIRDEPRLIQMSLTEMSLRLPTRLQKCNVSGKASQVGASLLHSKVRWRRRKYPYRLATRCAYWQRLNQGRGRLLTPSNQTTRERSVYALYDLKSSNRKERVALSGVSVACTACSALNLSIALRVPITNEPTISFLLKCYIIHTQYTESKQSREQDFTLSEPSKGA
jgi:hypothetical protein